MSDASDAGLSLPSDGALPSDGPLPRPDTGARLDVGIPPEPSPPDACVGLDSPIERDVIATLDQAGTTRTYHIHLPPSYDAQSPMALVFNFHGWMQTYSDHRDQSGLDQTADREGFITVHPEGIDTSWNAGNCCGTAQSQGVDDLAFFDAMLQALEQQYCIDARRVYATGMSNGGFLSHRLACERASVVAAIAPVAGLLGVETCEPSRAVPVLDFHGTADFIVGYTTSFTGLAGAPMTIERWRSINQCDASSTISFEMGDVRCERWTCAEGAEVELCTVQDGGHTWPGGMPTPLFGKTSTAIDASSYLWEFFERHPLP